MFKNIIYLYIYNLIYIINTSYGKYMISNKTRKKSIIFAILFLLMITFSLDVYAQYDVPFEEEVNISPFWFGRINYQDGSPVELKDSNFTDVNLNCLNCSFTPRTLNRWFRPINNNDVNNLFIFGLATNNIPIANINNFYAIDTNYEYADGNFLPLQYVFRLIK